MPTGHVEIAMVARISLCASGEHKDKGLRPDFLLRHVASEPLIEVTTKNLRMIVSRA